MFFLRSHKCLIHVTEGQNDTGIHKIDGTCLLEVGIKVPK